MLAGVTIRIQEALISEVGLYQHNQLYVFKKNANGKSKYWILDSYETRTTPPQIVSRHYRNLVNAADFISGLCSSACSVRCLEGQPNANPRSRCCPQCQCHPPRPCTNCCAPRLPRARDGGTTGHRAKSSAARASTVAGHPVELRAGGHQDDLDPRRRRPAPRFF